MYRLPVWGAAESRQRPVEEPPADGHMSDTASIGRTKSDVLAMECAYLRQQLWQMRQVPSVQHPPESQTASILDFVRDVRRPEDRGNMLAMAKADAVNAVMQGTELCHKVLCDDDDDDDVQAVSTGWGSG